jgi:hypothetical protein
VSIRQTAAIGLCLGFTLSAGAVAEQPRATSPAVAAFVSRLQQAVIRHDARAVASLFRFPATVLIGGWRIPMENARTFLGVYDELFTPQLRCQLEQKPAVQVAGDGISLGDGAIWAQLHQGQFKIQRLIVPPSSVPRRVRQQSRQVAFADLRYPARYAGTLVQDDVDSYVVAVKKGQVVRARIDGFRGRDAVLRGGRRADPQSARADTANQRATRAWTVRAGEQTEFRLDVVRLAPYCDPAVTYALTITLE